MRMLEIFIFVDIFKDKKKFLGNIWIFFIKKGQEIFDYDFEYEIIDVYVIIFCFIDKRCFGYVYVFNFFVIEYFGLMRYLLEVKVLQSLDKFFILFIF